MNSCSDLFIRSMYCELNSPYLIIFLAKNNLQKNCHWIIWSHLFGPNSKTNSLENEKKTDSNEKSNFESISAKHEIEHEETKKENPFPKKIKEFVAGK